MGPVYSLLSFNSIRKLNPFKTWNARVTSKIITKRILCVRHMNVATQYENERLYSMNRFIWPLFILFFYQFRSYFGGHGIHCKDIVTWSIGRYGFFFLLSSLSLFSCPIRCGIFQKNKIPKKIMLSHKNWFLQSEWDRSIKKTPMATYNNPLSN